jgi:ferredoxin
MKFCNMNLIIPVTPTSQTEMFLKQFLWATILIKKHITLAIGNNNRKTKNKFKIDFKNFDFSDQTCFSCGQCDGNKMIIAIPLNHKCIHVGQQMACNITSAYTYKILM